MNLRQDDTDSDRVFNKCM